MVVLKHLLAVMFVFQTKSCICRVSLVFDFLVCARADDAIASLADVYEVGSPEGGPDLDDSDVSSREGVHALRAFPDWVGHRGSWVIRLIVIKTNPFARLFDDWRHEWLASRVGALVLGFYCVILRQISERARSKGSSGSTRSPCPAQRSCSKNRVRARSFPGFKRIECLRMRRTRNLDPEF